MSDYDPLDAVEMRRGMQSIAEMTRVFYAELVEQGFSRREALALTQTWLHATVRNAMEGGSDDE